MSNQRRGKMHAAGVGSDDRISLRALIEYVKDAKSALESADEEDAAFRFEMMLDFLQNDVCRGKPLVFTSKTLGL